MTDLKLKKLIQDMTDIRSEFLLELLNSVGEKLCLALSNSILDGEVVGVAISNAYIVDSYINLEIKVGTSIDGSLKKYLICLSIPDLILEKGTVEDIGQYLIEINTNTDIKEGEPIFLTPNKKSESMLARIDKIVKRVQSNTRPENEGTSDLTEWEFEHIMPENDTIH